MKSLYEITSLIKRIEIEILESEGEINEEQEALLKEIPKLLKEKTDSCADYIRSQLSYASSIQERIDELSGLKLKVLNKVDRFNAYVISSMQQMKTKEIKGKFDRILLPKPRSFVFIRDEKLIETEYIRVKKTVTIDKRLIQESFDAGVDVKGAEIKAGPQKINYKTM